MKNARFWLRLTMIVLAVMIGWLVIVPRFRAPVHIPPVLGQMQEFRLTAHTGQPFGLLELEGAVWIANFIFTRCQGPCPLMTKKMAALEHELPRGEALRFVTVSVDPQYDTPEVLAAYARERGATSVRWHFLTGEPRRIYGLLRDGFMLPLGAQQASKDEEIIIPHSQKFVVVDPTGAIRGYYDSDDKAALQQLRSDVMALLKTAR